MTCCRFRLTHECEVRQVVILMNQFQLIVYMNTNGKQWLWSAIPRINIFAGMGLTVNTWERNCARVYYNILQKATDCIFSDLVEEDQIGSCKWHCLAAIYRHNAPQLTPEGFTCTPSIQTQLAPSFFSSTVLIHRPDNWHSSKDDAICRTAKPQFFSIFEPVEIDVPVW
jgi:hypothetical protein